MVTIKRAYDPPNRADGTRVLVDRIWPRGIKKDQLRIAKWMREIGPSSDLRKFFGHDPARWQQFRKRYLAELDAPETSSLVSELLEVDRHGTLTLVYSAKDKEHNQAVVLKELLDAKLAKE